MLFNSFNSSLKYCSFTAGLKIKSRQLFKKTREKHKSKDQEKIQKRHKNTQHTVIKTFKYKGSTEMSDNFSNHI